jgi:hypothetical protein
VLPFLHREIFVTFSLFFKVKKHDKTGNPFFLGRKKHDFVFSSDPIVDKPLFFGVKFWPPTFSAHNLWPLFSQILKIPSGFFYCKCRVKFFLWWETYVCTVTQNANLILLIYTSWRFLASFSYGKPAKCMKMAQKFFRPKNSIN